MEIPVVILEGTAEVPGRWKTDCPLQMRIFTFVGNSIRLYGDGEDIMGPLIKTVNML